MWIRWTGGWRFREWPSVAVEYDPPTPNRGKQMLDNLPAISAPARTLGAFACGLTFEHIPAAVLERAKLLILDALGCGIASNAYGFSDAALGGATALGGVGRCSVIGRAN